MTTEDIFEDPTIPFKIIKKGEKDAVYDVINKKYLTKFEKHRYSVRKSSNEKKFYDETGGRLLVLNAISGESILIIDGKVIHKVNGAEFNFFSMDPNLDYMCISERENHSEYIFDIKNKKQVTPKFRAIFPVPEFPKLPLYKARNNSKEAIFSFPDNKQLTPWFDDISSVGKGALGGGNDYYSTTGEMGEVLFWKKWGIPILHDLPEKVVEKILNDLKGKITNRIIIKRLFKVFMNF